MDTFNTKIERITTAKENIKQSLINKGTSPSDNLEDYAALIDGLGNSGSAEGAKIFASIDDMNNDASSKEGDIALIYGKGYVPFQKDTKAQVLYFPAEVILPEAITGELRVALEGSNVWGEAYIQSDSFGMYLGLDSGDISIQYSSEDGKHYTRTDTLDSVIDLGAPIYVSMPEYYWTEYFGYFCQVEGNLFNGIYKYQSYTDKLALTAPDLSTFTYDSSTPALTTTGTVEVDINDVSEYLDLIDYKNVGWTNFEVLLTSDKVYILPIRGNTSFTMPYYNTATNKLYYCAAHHYAKSSDKYQNYFIGAPMVKIIDKTTKTVTDLDLDTVTEFGYIDTYSFPYEMTMKVITEMPLENTTHSLTIDYDPDMDKFTYFYVWYSNSYINSGNKLGIAKGETVRLNHTFTRGYVNKEGYLLANTQLTAIHSDVYKQTFYGGQGIQTGTLGNKVSKDLNDTANELYTKFTTAYQDFTPITIEELSNNYNLSSMYSIPVNYNLEPLIDCSSATNCYGMFRTWNNLIAVPKLDLRNVTDIAWMFHQDTNLKYMAAFEIPKVTSMSSFVATCPSLTDDSLNNILATMLTATAYTGTKTLSYIGLSQEQRTKCTTLSNWAALSAAGWTTGD